MNGLLHLGHAFSLSKVRCCAAGAGAAALARAPADGRAAGGRSWSLRPRTTGCAASACSSRKASTARACPSRRARTSSTTSSARTAARRSSPRRTQGCAARVAAPPRAALKRADRPPAARSAPASAALPEHAQRVLGWLSRTHATCRSLTEEGAVAHCPLPLRVLLCRQRLRATRQGTVAAACGRHGAGEDRLMFLLTKKPAPCIELKCDVKLLAHDLHAHPTMCSAQHGCRPPFCSLF